MIVRAFIAAAPIKLTAVGRVTCLNGLFFLAAVGSSEAVAQVVQLPTFRTFRIGTTVLVPDGGSASLGGISSASYGRTSRGVPILGRVPGAGRFFRNTAVGSSRSATSSRVYADIIDMEEMDRAVLAEAERRRALSGTPAPGATASSTRGPRTPTSPPIRVIDSRAEMLRKAEFITRNIGRTSIE